MNTTMFNQTAKASCLKLLSALFALMSTLPQLAFADINSGQQLYLTHCAGCHGMNGISVIPQAKDFSSARLLIQPDQALINTIRSGRNMMPAYFGILNDREILDVLSYLRTLN